MITSKEPVLYPESGYRGIWTPSFLQEAPFSVSAHAIYLTSCRSPVKILHTKQFLKSSAQFSLYGTLAFWTLIELL